MMIVVCCVCKKTIEYKFCNPKDDGKVTHSYCDSCYEELNRKLDEEEENDKQNRSEIRC